MVDLRKTLSLFGQGRALVTAGDEHSFNTMTIGWGGLGTLWKKPVATVYVKPIRYTHRFLKANELFTVSFYPEECGKALAILGTRSGRDCDKVALSGLTPLFLPGAVTFREALATLVCKKIYEQDLDLGAMPKEVVEHYYSPEAPHTMFIGEVIDLIGT